MAKSWAHKKAQWKAAGPGGRTEVKLQSGRRLDALSHDGYRATEVEFGNFGRMLKAAGRLAESGAQAPVLAVPYRNIRAAAAAMRVAGLSGWIRDINGTTKFYVKC